MNFNRTKLELKDLTPEPQRRRKFDFNRTKLELKAEKADKLSPIKPILIAPNWN